MARPSQWIQHLDRALEELKALTASTVDRAAIEKLFHVSSRQALRILDRFPAYAVGTSLLIDRTDLVRKLEALRENPVVQFERQRKERVEAELARARRKLLARRIEIPTNPDVWQREFVDLPPSVRIEQGRLEITFEDTRDLLRQLFELSQAVANDYASFQRLCEPNTTVPSSPKCR